MKTNEMIKIKISGPKLIEETIEINKGTTVEEVLQEYKDKMPYPIYACVFDNCYRGLKHILTHDGTLQFLDITNQATWTIYQNSLELLYIKAVHDICGKQTLVTIANSLNKGLYTFTNPLISKEQIQAVENRMKELAKLDIPINKEYMSKKEALELAKSHKLKETYKLLNSINNIDSIHIFSLDDEVDIFYDLMVPSTSYLQYFELRPYKVGALLRYPHPENPLQIPEYEDQTLLYNAFSQANKWGNLMNVEFIADLNEMTKDSNKYEDLFLMQEALHEKNISDISDMIKQENKRVVLICGPSSSGKTTFAKRLCIQLRVNGLKPLYLGTDDYFVEADEKPRDENGEIDLESIKAVDTDLFKKQLNELLQYKEVDLPVFDFLNNTKVFGTRLTKLDKNGVIVIEGIHALNKLLTDSVNDNEKFKIYISPFTPIGIDHHNRIPTTDARMLRRLVRDHQFRGRSASTIIQEWAKVRKSENVNIFPFNVEADVFFNSNCIYELAVLKKYAQPLLQEIKRSEPEYAEAQRMLEFLKFVETIDDDSAINQNSIIREFIGGSSIVK